MTAFATVTITACVKTYGILNAPLPSHIYVFAKGVSHLCLVPSSGFNPMAACSTKPVLSHSMLCPPPRLCGISSLILPRRLCGAGPDNPRNLKHVILYQTHVLWQPAQPGPSSSVVPTALLSHTMGVQCLLKLTEMTMTLHQSGARQCCAKGHTQLKGSDRPRLNLRLFSTSSLLFLSCTITLRVSVSILKATKQIKCFVLNI